MTASEGKKLIRRAQLLFRNLADGKCGNCYGVDDCEPYTRCCKYHKWLADAEKFIKAGGSE